MDYLVLKIRSTINKGLEYFKYNKNDPYEGIRIMEKSSFSNYLYVSESIGDYLSGKRLIRRRFIILIFQLCIWTLALKSLLISYYNNKTLLVMTGDFTYLFPRHDILNVSVFLIFSGVAIAGKNSFFYSKIKIFKYYYL